jgi:peptidoglycan hydrolase-like protein with peptidoglycan-binding domain
MKRGVVMANTAGKTAATLLAVSTAVWVLSAPSLTVPSGTSTQNSINKQPGRAQKAKSINGSRANKTSDAAKMDPVQLQVLLDRANFSPAQIDGHLGKNTRRAIKSFQRSRGLEPTGKLDEQTKLTLWRYSGAKALVKYKIANEVTKGLYEHPRSSRRKIPRFTETFEETKS